MRVFTLLFVFLTLSCFSDGGTYIDKDGDGFSEIAGDCDDTDPLINPSSEEVPYDGIDQDCDGEDLLDVDMDGYIGIEAGGEDCDDHDPDIYPSAEELINDRDDDCDGEIDEGV
jgi:hypothetical protein